MMEAGRTQLLHSDLGAPGSETAGTGAYTWRVSLLYLPFQSRVRQLQANFYVNSPAPPPSQPTPWPFCCLEQIQTLDSEWWMSHSSCVFSKTQLLEWACSSKCAPLKESQEATQLPFKEGALGGIGRFQTIGISRESVLERQAGEMVLVILIWIAWDIWLTGLAA